MDKPIIVVTDKFYVPKQYVNRVAYRRFTHEMFEDAMCAKCPYMDERPSFQCEGCPANLGVIKTYKERVFRGDAYIGLPLGQKEKFDLYMTEDYDHFDIIDKRYKTKFEYPIEFGGRKQGELRDYQEVIVNDFLKKKYGLIESPPRSGKTMMALNIGIRLGYRMLVIASQNEFLNQFIEHVHDYSNLPELEKKHGKKLYGVVKKEEDFFNYQIAASTYQRFLSEKGRELLKVVSPNFGTVWADEVHRFSATCASRVISAFPCRVKFGSTGTVERKDGKEKIIRDIIGPIVASSTVESMTPIVRTVLTGLKPRNKYKQWTYAMQWLAKNDDRNQMIIDQVFVDVAQGHSIIIPCLFRNHIAELTRRINAEYGTRIADYFVGGNDKKNLAKRDLVLDDAKSGKIKVVVGTRSLLQLGLNVPRWSKIYEVFPISNKPNLKQETSRIRTPMDGKKTPEILFFVDELEQSLYCYKSSSHHCQQFKYTFDESSHHAVAEVAAKLGVRNWLVPSSRPIDPKGKMKINGRLF